MSPSFGWISRSRINRYGTFDPPCHTHIQYELLIDFISFPTWVFYGLSVIGLLLLRKSWPTATRALSVPIPAAVLFIAVSAFVVFFPFFPTPSDNYPYWLPPVLGTTFIACGYPVWWAMARGKADASMDFAMH